MNLILIAEVRKVGHKGQIVTVSDGFGMNFLIPRHLGVQATASALKLHEHDVRIATQHSEENATRAKKLATELAGKVLTIDASASDTGTLFKAIRAEDIVAEIRKQWGVEVPEEAVHIETPIKDRGTHLVSIEIGQERCTLEVTV
jgi:large subunit ribosomal protein L9